LLRYNILRLIVFFAFLDFAAAEVCPVEPGAVLLDVELDSTQLDNVSSVELVVLQRSIRKITYEVVLCTLGVSHDHKHFVVNVFVCNRVTIRISGSHSHQSIVLNLECPVVLLDDNHWLCVLIDVCRPGPDRNKLDIVVDPENLASCLSLDVFLGNVLRLVVKQTMGVSRPRYTPHVDFVLGVGSDWNLVFGRSVSSEHHASKTLSLSRLGLLDRIILRNVLAIRSDG